MLNNNDLLQLQLKNISVEQVQDQLRLFIEGFPFIEIKTSASVGNGIVKLSDEEQIRYIAIWDEYLNSGSRVTKFVPASGAASRMFKDVFAFISASYNFPTTDFEKKFFNNISSFAFYETLDYKCFEKESKGISELINCGQYKTIAEYLLDSKGLNYGSLPKGLLLFHKYKENSKDSIDITNKSANRTSFGEHLAEGALYASCYDKTVRLHFTVSPEHQPLFEELAAQRIPYYEQLFGVRYILSFSVQQTCTDTIAVDLANAPFRDLKGRLVFRPGGHGALIQNLNALDSDIVFIKNIDNVVPDCFKQPTVHYKKVIAGMLVDVQKKIFDYVRLIDSGNYTHLQIEEIIHFVHDTLCIRHPDMKYYEDAELAIYLRRKLMRPLRVCGMVRNEGEPGGGPFLTKSQDGSIQLQILESTQIDMNNDEARMAFENGSHFNPVDLVCGLKDAYGNKYNLPDYVDKNTGFISQKSKDGRELKALELPGLWNGAMSDWNSIFVEVSPETFNPVKNVNDLLRKEHQPN